MTNNYSFQTPHAICVLGGMGPDASARFYQLLIQLAREEYAVTQNDEYPEIIIHSVPVPDFVSNMASAEEALRMLKKRVKLLSSLQPTVFGMSCNTAHIYINELREQTSVPFLSIIDQVGCEVAAKKYKKVGVLASPSTIQFGLYQSQLEKINVQPILPISNEQIDLGDIIHSLIGGDRFAARKRLMEISQELLEKGAEALVLGCTELPLIFPEAYSVPVVDSLVVLAKALLREYYTERKV